MVLDRKNTKEKALSINQSINQQNAKAFAKQIVWYVFGLYAKPILIS